MDLVLPGTGSLPCQGESRDGEPCRRREVEGLEYCLWHMPEEYLDEAEEITGVMRCRHTDAQGRTACHQMAVKGTDPPRCKNHGANPGSIKHRNAQATIVEGRVQDRMIEIMSEKGERLLSPRQLGNPLVELLDLAAEMAEWKDIMRDIVVYLLSQERIRSAHSKVGEQLRAEVLLFERAQERYSKILQDIARLGIEHRLAALEETQVRMVEQALAAALNSTSLDVVAQEEARQVLRRELTRAAKKTKAG
jgi:hypothetical protein